MEQARSGFDPIEIEAKRRNAEVRQRDATFDRLVERFMTEHVETNLRPTTAREYRRYLQGNDTAPWWGKPVSSITKDDVTTVILSIKDRGSPGAAGRGLAYLSKFFNWCAQHDIIETPPTLRLSAPVKSRSRDRVLTSEELAIIWQAFEVEGGLFGPLFQLLLLTGQRRGEIAGLQWREIEGRNTPSPVINVPKSRTKNKRPHRVPLSPPALAITNRMPITSDFVFSAKRDVQHHIAAQTRAVAETQTEFSHKPIGCTQRTKFRPFHSPLNTRQCLMWVNFYRFDGHQTMSGMPPKADLFRQNVWIAPNIGLVSSPMKTGILCQ